MAAAMAHRGMHGNGVPVQQDLDGRGRYPRGDGPGDQGVSTESIIKKQQTGRIYHHEELVK